LQAALLRIKLPLLDSNNKKRQLLASVYCQLLSDVEGVHLPNVSNENLAVWHAFVVRTPYRSELSYFLTEKGIATLIHYPIAQHMQPAYQELGC
jgi:dTDP-4-amino-4,6-dideoxygalactose transaminase